MREHTEAISPPRALWVPFMLGRPLGAPDDAPFQRRVMLAALKLLERGAGPVLEDFPEDAPPGDAPDEHEIAACPVSFAPAGGRASLAESVTDEIAGLRMWYELAVRRRGRTAAGVTARPLDELVRYIAAHADNARPPGFHEGLADADALRLACEDIKAYYGEARSAQPGAHGGSAARNWFWAETAAGRLFRRLHDALEHADDPLVRDFARTSLIPRAVRHAQEGGKGE